MRGSNKHASGIPVVLAWLLALPALAQTQPQLQSPVSTDPAYVNELNGAVSVRELAAIIAERDRQYAQRFEAQQQAVNSALQAQGKATAAAFAAAEKAVAAALAAQEKATQAAFAAANTAVSKAELAGEKRFDSVNEFRAQLKDQAATLSTRAEVAVQIKAVSDKLDLTSAAVNELRSRGEGASSLWMVIAGGIGLLIGLAGVLLKFRGHPA